MNAETRITWKLIFVWSVCLTAYAVSWAGLLEVPYPGAFLVAGVAAFLLFIARVAWSRPPLF